MPFRSSDFMRKLLLLFLFASGLILGSCRILSMKQYNSLISERDSLSGGWNSAKIKIESMESELEKLRADTGKLNARIAELQSKVEGLDENYASLRSNSSAEIKKLIDDLQKREVRLKEVEEILRKRDQATNALKEKLQKALLGFRESGLTVEIRNGKVYVSLTDKLLFNTGSIIIDEKGKQALTELSKVLKTQADINISVEGHTDNQKVVNLGQIKDNWDLSVLRSTSVVRYLTEVQKIDGTRVTATGKGEFQPILTGNTPEIRSRNRRIEIVLSPKLDELYELINEK